VTTWSQPLVVRSESPVETIGGGQVLDPDAPKLRRRQEATLTRLADLWSDDPVIRASAALYFAGSRERQASDWHPEDLARTAGIDDVQEVCDRLIERGDLIEIPVSRTRTHRIHRAVLEELAGRVESVLKKMHREYPLKSLLDRARLTSRFAYLRNDPLLRSLLERMAAEGRVTLGERGIGLSGHGPQLSTGQRELLEQIVDIFRQAGYQPPSLSQLATQVTHHQDDIPQLVELAEADGRLVQISPEFYLEAELEQQMRVTVAEKLSDGQGLTVGQIREILATSRKYAVPLCEHLDRIGVTRRQGDVRVSAG